MKKRSRKNRLLAFEREARLKGHFFIAGIDEAGRGPLAGPVVACACILPQDFYHPVLDDSKKLTADQRDSLFPILATFQHGIGIVHHEEIDHLNIYQATIKAMLIAIDKIPQKPDYMLIDGMKLPSEIPHEKIIDGDALSHSIAAASVLAKVTRDRLMVEYDKEHPHWGFAKHKGYATPGHKQAILKHGLSPIHRLSFCKKSIKIEPLN